MKVLHVNNYLQKGGAETVFKLTIEGLKRYYPNVDNYIVYSLNKDMIIKDKVNKDEFILDNFCYYKKLKELLNTFFL